MVGRIDKVVGGLPVALTADTLYAIRTGLGFNLFLTDQTGATAHELNVANRKWDYSQQRGLRFYSYPDGRYISDSDNNFGASDINAAESAGNGGTPIIEWENVGFMLSPGETLVALDIAGRINDATNTPDVELYFYFVRPDSISRLSAGWDNDNEVVATLLYKDLWKSPVTGDLGQAPNSATANDFAFRSYPVNFTAPEFGWFIIIADPVRAAGSTGTDYFYARTKYCLRAPPK